MRKIGGNVDTFGSTDVLKGFCGRFPAQGSPVVGVHPPGNSGAVCLRYRGQRAAFLEPAAYHTVGVLVAATLTAGERMAVVAVCTAATSWGVLQTVTVGELGAVVHGDALEDVTEVRPALKEIQNSHHGGAVLSGNFEDQLQTCHAFSHDDNGLTLPLLSAYDTIHLPMTEGGAARDDRWALLYACTVPGRFLLAAIFPRMLPDTMFREIRGTGIQQAAPEVAVDGILTEIAEIRAAQRRRYPRWGAAFFLDMQRYVGEQLRVSGSFQRCTAVPPALLTAIISGIGRVDVILPQIVVELKTISIAQLTVDGGDMAAQQPGDLTLAMTSTEQRFKLHAAIMIEPFPSCHFQILQNQIAQMTARLDSYYAGALTARPARGSATGSMPLCVSTVPKEGIQERLVWGSRVPTGRESRQNKESQQQRGRRHASRARAPAYPHGERDPRRGDRRICGI